MSTSVVFFGWNRSVPGREMVSAQHFQEFVEYLGTQQRGGIVESFDTVFLEAHGGPTNGFFLIRGEGAKLAQLTASDDWLRHQARAILHLEGAMTVRGFTGAAVAQRMDEWVKAIPK